MAHDIRDELVDFVRDWSERTEINYERMLKWIALSARKFRDWRSRYGKANEHNHLVPRDHWLESWEKEAIVGFFQQYPHNTLRLHSALGYVTPQDRLQGRHLEIYAARDQKLEAAREKRRQRRANPQFSL